jgi:hypothetical protein
LASVNVDSSAPGQEAYVLLAAGGNVDEEVEVDDSGIDAVEA